MAVLADLIKDVTLEHRRRLALVDTSDGSELTYSDLNDSFNRLANALAPFDIAHGDHLAIFHRNSRHWIFAEGGLSKAGVVAVLVNRYLSSQEVAWILNHSEAVGVIFGDTESAILDPVWKTLNGCRLGLCATTETGACPTWAHDLQEILNASPTVEPAVEIRAGDPQRILYTSATSGLPKGVVSPNEIVVDGIVATLANQLRDVQASDRFLAVTPLHHVAGRFFWAFFGRGASSVLAPTFRPDEMCSALLDFGITHTFLAPTMLIKLLRLLRERPRLAADIRRSSLRAVWYAGSPIPASIAREAEDVLGPILNQQYGLTELFAAHPSMAVTALTSSWHRSKEGSCGQPLLGSVVRVVDDDGRPVMAGTLGEIVVKMHSRGGTYWRRRSEDDLAFRDGWIYTGDIGYFDEDGFLYLTDRKTDMIISGGFNIYPAEVENILSQHPAVQESAVVGVADPTWVEVPCAVVVAREGMATSEEELIQFTRDRIAHFKAPKHVIFIDSLPLGGTGKVLKRELRKLVEVDSHG